MSHCIRAILVILLFGTAAFAQTATVTKNAPIYVTQNPPETLSPLRVAAVGTVLKVVGQEGEWLQVQFEDPQWGLRTGWVKAEFVTVRRPELEPMDLSIKPQQPPPTEAAPPADSSRQPATAPRQRLERGWLDVNVGFAVSGFDEPDFEYYGVGGEFDVGGGVMITRFLGVGVSFVGTAHLPSDDYDDDLWRTEGSANIQAMVVPLHRENMRLRIFGGPSYFSFTDDLIFAEGNGWGFHVGADFSYFFTRVVGVGGFGRYSYAKASDWVPDIILGGVQLGGGLRLRF